MRKMDAIEIFGSARALANAIGITEQAVSQWGDDVPELRVYQIRELARELSAIAHDDSDTCNSDTCNSDAAQ